MLKRISAWTIVIAALATPSGVAQQPPPRIFRYLSEWTVPRRNVAAFAAELEKNVRPILERMMQEGTISEYGTYVTLVKEEEGSTNGYFFGGVNQAALRKVLDELAKLPPSEIADSATKQHDYLLRHQLRLAKASSGTNGYLYFNSTLLQPGKQEQWRQWWDHYQKPLYDKFLADGLVTMYEVDGGEMHTMDPNMQYLVWISPTPEALDKMNDAWVSRGLKQTPEEKREMALGLETVVVAGSHRDYFARALSYASK